MEKIASFTIDHLRLMRGIFLSRKDRFGDLCVSTFDIRMKEPNREPVMDLAALHTIEHLGATILRASPVWGPKTIYFGPMGCRTGLYVIFAGEFSSEDVLPMVKAMFEGIVAWEGEVPGAKAIECGNWREHNVDMARWEARKFLEEVLGKPGAENLHYPV